MRNRPSSHAFVRSGARWVAAVVLIAAAFILGPRQAAAEGTEAASGIVDAYTAAAEDLIASAAGLLGGETVQTAGIAHQNLQLLDDIRDRLVEYDAAFDEMAVFENERTVGAAFAQLEPINESELANMYDAITGMKAYYRALAESAEPIAGQRYRFEELNDAVNAMMQRDDLFIAHFIPGMWIVLDSVYRTQLSSKWNLLVSERHKRRTLDQYIERYEARLLQALDPSRPTSLAGRAEVLKSSLREIENDLNDNGFAMISKELIKKETIIIQIAQVQFYDYLLDISKYALLTLKFGEWGSDPRPENIHRKIDLRSEDQYIQILKLFEDILEKKPQPPITLPDGIIIGPYPCGFGNIRMICEIP